MLKEEVDEEEHRRRRLEVDEHPASRLMEGEIQKLIHMEERLHQRRVVGQDEAIVAVSNAIRARGPDCRTRTGRWAASSSWA